MPKYIYKYNPVSFEYTNSEPAYLDPEETKIQGKNVYSLPADATFDKPPKTVKNEVAIYDISNTNWLILPDYRDMYMVGETLQPVPVLKFGELPEGYIAITEAQATKIQEDPLYYIIQDGELIINPDYDLEKLAIAKQDKYNEANNKATEYLEGGSALYEFEEDRHIEATSNNISKIGLRVANLVLKQDFTSTFPWNTKEDENIYLNAITGQEVAEGLGAIQDEVWTVKFPNYVAQIEAATTVEEVKAIEVNYDI